MKINAPCNLEPDSPAEKHVLDSMSGRKLPDPKAALACADCDNKYSGQKFRNQMEEMAKSASPDNPNDAQFLICNNCETLVPFAKSLENGPHDCLNNGGNFVRITWKEIS